MSTPASLLTPATNPRVWLIRSKERFEERDYLRDKVASGSVTFHTLCMYLPLCSQRGAAHTFCPLDLVVSNPPYIFRKDMEQLAPEICSYEDLVALDGGDEGMDIITHILTLAPQLLNASGSIFLEVDPRHPELVSSWLQSHPDLHLSLVGVREDFCGRPRFLHVQKSAP